MHRVLAATLVKLQSAQSFLVSYQFLSWPRNSTEPADPLPHSQIPSTFLYPESDEFISRPHIMFLEDTF